MYQMCIHEKLFYIYIYIMYCFFAKVKIWLRWKNICSVLWWRNTERDTVVTVHTWEHAWWCAPAVNEQKWNTFYTFMCTEKLFGYPFGVTLLHSLPTFSDGLSLKKFLYGSYHNLKGTMRCDVNKMSWDNVTSRQVIERCKKVSNVQVSLNLETWILIVSECRLYNLQKKS